MTDTYTTARIPDEAMQVAHAEYHKVLGDKSRSNPMLAALTAALPHLSAPCAVVVKKLGEWRRGYCDDCVTIEQASTGFGSVYQVRVLNGVVWLDFPDNKEQEFFDVKTAKAAAQADFERRVLSCVVTKPVDVATVRETLEDLVLPIVGHLFVARGGATVRGIAGLEHGEDESSPLVRLSDVAKALEPFRALSAKPAQGEQWLDIDTAPKDGSVILAWHISHKCPVPVMWKDDGFPYQGKRLNWIERTYTTAWPERAFSHWMPLPTAPTPEAGK